MLIWSYRGGPSAGLISALAESLGEAESFLCGSGTLLGRICFKKAYMLHLSAWFSYELPTSTGILAEAIEVGGTSGPRSRGTFSAGFQPMSTWNIPKPIDKNDVIRFLLYAEVNLMGKIIAVANQKGAETTTAVNLAASLAAQKQKSCW